MKTLIETSFLATLIRKNYRGTGVLATLAKKHDITKVIKTMFQENCIVSGNPVLGKVTSFLATLFQENQIVTGNPVSGKSQYYWQPWLRNIIWRL